MKSCLKYICLLLVLLSVMMNITGGTSVASSQGEKVNGTVEGSFAQYKQSFFSSSQGSCLEEIFRRDASSNTSSVNYRLLPGGQLLFGCLSNQINVGRPIAYQNVLLFDIDNLATLNHKDYYIFSLRKIRI